MLSRFKIISICFATSLILLITLFWGAISSKLVEYSVRSYCKECLRANLTEENLEFDGQYIVFENPKLIGILDKQDHLIADKLVLFFEPHLLKREIDLYFTLVNPKIDLTLMGTSLALLLDQKNQRSSFFKINHLLQIKNGKLTNFKDSKEIYFTSDHDFIVDNELKLSMNLNSIDDAVNSMQVHLLKNEKNIYVANFNFNHLCCKTVSEIVGTVFPGFNQFEVTDGLLNGDAKFTFNEDKSFKTASDIVTSHLSFVYKPLKIYGTVPIARLYFPKKNRGHIDLEGATLSFKPTALNFLEYSKLIGNGSLDINLQDANRLITLDFKGNAEHVVSFFPDVHKKYFEEAFHQNELSLKGHLKKLIDSNTADEFFSFDGEFNIFSPKTGIDETLAFGFELEGLSQNLKTEKLSLQNGWFKAFHVDIEKYLSPLLFQDSQIKLSGFGDFEGQFDQEKIQVDYLCSDVVLENEDFIIEQDRIYDGKHFFDLKTGKNFGKIPVRNGTYFEKNTGLLFTDIQADFDLTKEKISTPFIETFCNGAYFSGSQEIDLSSPIPKEFNVNFHVTNMKAKFAEVQHIFSHFNKPYFFLKMPLECDVFLRQQGAFIGFQFSQDTCTLQGAIQGEIANGTIKSDNFDLSIQELNLNFDYDHMANDLVFSDIQGTLLVGKPERVEEYLVAGDHVRFTDYSANASQFDLWVGDKNRDMIRIAGITKQPDEKRLDEDLVEIALNTDLSHFGDMRLKSCYCVLKNWNEVDALDVQLKFDLKPFLNDLQRFSRTGFLFLSRGLLKELNSLKKASGDFSLNLGFDKVRGIFNYDIQADRIELGAYQFETALLKGKKVGHTWSIEELKLDNLSGAADISQKGEAYKIDFLGLKAGGSLLVGMEGDYNPADNSILAEINLCEVNLESLDEFPICKQLKNEYDLKGKVKCEGKLKILLDSEKLKPHVDISLDANLTGFQIKELKLSDVEKISCRYLTDKGLTLKGFKTAVNQKNREIALLDIEKIEYGFKNQSLLLEEAKVKLPAANLKSLSKSLEKTFPDFFNKTALDVFKNSKKQDYFEGAFNLDISHPFYGLHLTLKDGYYHFLDHDHYLQNFMIDFDPCEFKLSTKYEYNDYPFLLELQSKSKNLEFGKLVIIDQKESPSKNEGDEEIAKKTEVDEETESTEELPLAIYWRKNKDEGLSVETVEGSLSGLNMQLYRNPDEPLENGKFHLTGEILVDMNRFKSLLPVKFAENLNSLKVGSGYALKGNWTLFNGENLDFSSSLFKGELLGNEFGFKGYQFQSLKAKVDYQKNKLMVNDFKLTDTCGTFSSDEIRFTTEDETPWKVNMPLLHVDEFRPSLTRQIDNASNSAAKPFVIGQMELENLEGNLLDETSFTGYGRFSFRNPHKKNVLNTIFAIPNEIISRIGLNLTVLTPVIGVVEYQLLDGKVLFTRFKDVYSEGKLSKFYLADTPYPSYVDYEGNLFMKVRMKQYNLLFKLAELFTVSVQGNLKKPTYSFHKHIKHEIEELELTQDAI